MPNTQTIINTVYNMLKDRDINPRGKFDSAGRFYASNSELISVRSPSRAWPYPEMMACRTKKYVKKVAGKFNCETVSQLINCV